MLGYYKPAPQRETPRPFLGKFGRDAGAGGVVEPWYAGVDWCQQKKTYREGTPHTAATTYHYIASYTLWLQPQMLWPLEGQSRFSWGTV